MSIAQRRLRRSAGKQFPSVFVPTSSHTEYSGTFAHWLLNEATGGTTATSTVGGAVYDLVVTGATITAPTTPLVRGREFFEDTGASMKSAATQVPRAFFLADYWVAFWVKYTATASNVQVFAYAGTVSDETEAENELLTIRILGATKLVRMNWESGAGLNKAVSSSIAIVPEEWTHVICSKTVNGGNSFQRIYINGIRRANLNSVNPTGGTGGTVRLALGSTGGNSIAEPMSGVIDDLICVAATLSDGDAASVFAQTAGL